MNTRTWMILFTSAGLGLSACSPSSQPVKETEEKLASVNIPSDAFGSGYDYQQSTFLPAKIHPAPNAHQSDNSQHFIKATLSRPHAIQTPPAQHLSNHVAKPIQQPPAPISNGMPQLPRHELMKIGHQIFKNESGGNIKNLVHWNVGEDFAAMGIGHFTWYPKNRRQRFGNTFPDLLTYLEKNGVHLPAWLSANREYAPWRTKAELLRVKNTPKIQELTHLLYRTKDLQAKYIVERARKAMPRLVKTAPVHLRSKVANNLNAVANTPGGWYALIDYVNFKGEGLSRTGGYKGQNWGLLQVLEAMRPARPGQGALHAFADAARFVLQRRVNNSPPSRNENRWMAGWTKRVNTYRSPLS